MKISVIIPTYNCNKEYLKEAIESALHQTYKPFEVIVIDDGSTDDTKDFVTHYADQGVTYLFQENAGQSAARNYGIKMSQGDWIAFLDHDDVWINNKLEKQFNKVKDTNYSFVLTDMYLGERFDAEKKSFLSNYSKVSEGYIFDVLINRSFIFPSSVLVKKTVLEEYNCFDPTLRMMEDLDLFLKISRKYEIGVIREILVFRRVHNTNFSFHETALALKARYWANAASRLGKLNDWQLSQANKHYIETIYRLAYQEFKQNNLKQARKHFTECIGNRFNTFHSIKYKLLTYLPKEILNTLHLLYTKAKDQGQVN